MITVLPPFERGFHYKTTPLSSCWFELQRDVTIDLGIPIFGNVSFRDSQEREWVRLNDDALTIRAKYGWDGPTMAIRFEKVMLPSLIHDALLQMLETDAMRDRIDKPKADLLFYHAMKANGFLLRGPYYNAVRKLGHFFVKEHNTHSVILP